MNFITAFLLAIQYAIFLKIVILNFKIRSIFSLNSILAISSFLYITIPTSICLFYDRVVVNSVFVVVDIEAIFWASLVGTIIMIIFRYIPFHVPQKHSHDNAWLRKLFFVLLLFNIFHLIKFLCFFDFQLAKMHLSNFDVSLIRDLAYETEMQINMPFGYVLSALQIALFGYLWNEGGRIGIRRDLVIGLIPIMVLTIISLERHTLASFLVVFFSVLECGMNKSQSKKFYLGALLILISLFFFRSLLFSLLDVSYHNYLKVLFDPQFGGVEILGEFFNTYGTYLMIWNIDEAKLAIKEVLILLFSNIFVPPGITSYFYNFTQQPYPIDRIVELIKFNYGPHPAHSALTDIIIFGWWSLIGVSMYGIFLYRVINKHGQIDRLLYFYLLALFYLPFRGSLTLNAIRLIWIFLSLHILRWLLQKPYRFYRFKDLS